MRRLRVFLARLRGLLHARQLDRDLRQEIAAHLEEAIEEYIRQGLSPAEARRAALRSFGGVAQAEEAYRDARSFAWLDHTRRDLQYALRMMRRTPGFTVATIVTLALGIGANAVAFGVMNALILRPLPLPHAEHLVTVQPRSGMNHSFPNYRDLRDRNDVFSGLAAYRITVMGLETAEGSTRVWGYLATGNYFEVLGATPLLPILRSGRRSRTRREPVCRPQLRMLAEPLRRRSRDRGSGNPAERAYLYRPWGRPRGLPRNRALLLAGGVGTDVHASADRELLMARRARNLQRPGNRKAEERNH